MGGLSPELELRLGDLLIRPVASFSCQIWGVNFLDLGKGVDGNELERIHLSYLRHVLGVGMNRSYISGAQFYNLTSFKTGAWKIKVNSIHLHHINRNQRYCSVFCWKSQ